MPEILDEIILKAIEAGASDIHIIAETPPVMRINGDLFPMEEPDNKDKSLSFRVFKAGEILSLANGIMNEDDKNKFTEYGEVDLSFTSGGARLRANIYMQRGNTALAVRIISNDIPKINTLGISEDILKVMLAKKGLLLVTGPAGSGKTTTLASMIDFINEKKRCHIITIEDPVEYVHKNRRSIISQREIGEDTASFPVALRAALRQDPDVIMVGEMRDLDTISTAITAAETGHLVLATLHTGNAPQTIDRIIDVFPPHQQQQIKVQLANNLIGVISQKLIKAKTDRGRIMASELLLANAAVRNHIREGKIHQIYSAMQTGGREGMCTMDTSLQNLYNNNLIDFETALENANLPDKLIR